MKPAQDGMNLCATHTKVRDETPKVIAPAPSECRAMADILMCIGDKWTVMVVAALSAHGRTRYGELFKRINGVSQRMLTVTLRALERDGLVTRTIHPTIPPKVEYELSAKGKDLSVPLYALWVWARENRVDIENSRQAFDSANL